MAEEQIFDTEEEALAAAGSAEGEMGEEPLFDSEDEAIRAAEGDYDEAGNDIRGERLELEQAAKEESQADAAEARALEDSILAEAYRQDEADDRAMVAGMEQAMAENEAIDRQAAAMGMPPPPGLAEAFLGQMAIDRQTENDSMESPAQNTIRATKPMNFGLEPFPEEVGKVALATVGSDFPSLGPTGVMMDPNDRMNYSMVIMENTMLTSPMRAQLVDDAARNGTFVLEALPDQWFQARGLPIKRR